jgi:hypothetical protein
VDMFSRCLYVYECESEAIYCNSKNSQLDFTAWTGNITPIYVYPKELDSRPFLPLHPHHLFNPPQPCHKLLARDCKGDPEPARLASTIPLSRTDRHTRRLESIVQTGLLVPAGLITRPGRRSPSEPRPDVYSGGRRHKGNLVEGEKVADELGAALQSGSILVQDCRGGFRVVQESGDDQRGECRDAGMVRDGEGETQVGMCLGDAEALHSVSSAEALRVGGDKTVYQSQSATAEVFADTVQGEYARQVYTQGGYIDAQDRGEGGLLIQRGEGVDLIGDVE